MKLKYNRKEQHLEDIRENVVNYTGESLMSPESVFTEKMGFTKLYTNDINRIILDEVLNKNFTVVEDFSHIEFSKSRDEFICYPQIYKANKANFYILLDKNLHNSFNQTDEVYEENKHKIVTVFYKNTVFDGCKRVVEILNKFTIPFIRPLAVGKNIGLLLKEREEGDFIFSSFDVSPLPIDIDKMYNDDFAEVNNSIINSVRTGGTGIIMLHGTPGTGKTNYIKYLASIILEKIFVFIPFGKLFYLSDPLFLLKLVENKVSVIILEDCEGLLKAREISDNGGGFISTLLNLSDGILSDIFKIQIICTFNTTIHKIDEALLRDGRLLAQYHFKKLSVFKTQNLINEIDDEYTVTEGMALAEIFNFKNKALKPENHSSSIGF